MTRQSSEVWYKNAIIYGIDVEVFADGNGDGIGDFVGLIGKLDYLKDLGVNCIWLLPFYPSSNRDNGYDIVDYYSIDPRFGHIRDFERFVKEAKKREIRVIIDLVIHHTSDEHPWFQEAKRSVLSKYRNFYVWTEKIPSGKQPSPAFPGVEKSVWEYEKNTRSYYFHDFYKFEPDLNIVNPVVRQEIFNIMEFWLSFGITGFRVDAATMLFDRKGIKGTELKDSGDFMEKMHAFVTSRNPEALLLGEADVKDGKIEHFFGDGNRMSLLYNFLLNRYLFLSLAQENADGAEERLATLPQPPRNAQWVNFLRNNDELNINQLESWGRKIVFETFAPEKRMKIYNRGIRRRLAPMLNGDKKRILMCFSLLFSLPGAPLFMYGDEIGMGENLALKERASVRTPMQWNSEKNAGFSEGYPTIPNRRVICTGHFKYQNVNVHDEDNDPDSQLNVIKKMIAVRKLHSEIGCGEYKILESDSPQIFALHFEWKGKEILLCNNLSHRDLNFGVKEMYGRQILEFFSDGVYEKKETTASDIYINGYGFRWFEVEG